MSGAGASEPSLPGAPAAGGATASLLIQPAPEAVRRIARRWLEDAASACDRVREGTDAKSLHDLRVGLRRLRSTMRAYSLQLEDSAGRKLRRRVRDLARATAGSRDLEVTVEWLRTELRGLRGRPRSGVEWLLDLVEEHQRGASAKLVRLMASRWGRLHARLTESFATYTYTVRLDDAEPPIRFGIVAARLISNQAEVVIDHLTRVQTTRDPEDLHAARIAGKRLRYLVEPVAEAADGGALLDELRALQDALGEVQDARVLQVEMERALREAGSVPDDATPGLERLEQRARAFGAAALDAALDAWDAGAAARLAAGVAAFGERLRAAALDGLEIERKLLLRELPPEALGGVRTVIEQGYLPGTRIIERLRRVQAGEAVRHLRTVKDGRGVVRVELEEPISPALFSALWPLTEGRRLTKERFRVQAGDLAWEIDRFTDRDLVLAEVELAEPGIAAPLPDWLAPFVERDVTGEAAYLNVTLAR